MKIINKIALLQASTTLNYGTMMMITNFIFYFNKETDDKFNFYVDNEEENGIERLKHSTGIDRIYRLSEIGFFNKPNSIKASNKYCKFINYFKYFNQISDVFKINNFKHVMFFGGDDLSEYYSNRSLIYSLLKINNLVKNDINVHLVGQSIGPFSSWRKELTKRVLEKTYIYSRDRDCLDYLTNEMKVKKVVESADLAFLDLPMQNNSFSKLVNFEPNKYFTIIPSGIWNKYTNEYTEYIKSWVALVEQLLHNTEYSIILLAHVLKEGSSDAKIINDIFYNISNKNKDRVNLETKELLPFQVRTILGNGILTITGRMHGAISTFQMKKPAISLSYSVKFAGIIGKELGRNDLILESNNDSIWKSNLIVDSIMNKVNYTLNNYNKLINEINEKVEIEKKEALVQIKMISKIIQEKDKI